MNWFVTRVALKTITRNRIFENYYSSILSFTRETSTSRMFSTNEPKRSQQLLASKTPLQIQKRIKMGDTNAPKISVTDPLKDYKTLMDAMLDSNLDDDEQNERYKAIAAEARKAVWQLVFEDSNPENEKKAGELLKEHKVDACFYAPWDYNDWIVSFRDELLKRKMFDFWHNVVVKEELGLCCARDSDFFDDMEDPKPTEFYCHAGAIAPWESEKEQKTPTPTQPKEADKFVMPSEVSAVGSPKTGVPTADELKISAENPIKDYQGIVEKFLTQNTTSDDDESEEIYKLISESARNAVWSFLFDEPQPPSEDRQEKAGELLKEHKTDAVFYAPWVYNEWIVKLRDEVLKRGMLDFWRNHIVKNELGLCWAQDSDYFDDMDDPKPVEFYNHGGCKAPWLEEQAQNEANESKNLSAASK